MSHDVTLVLMSLKVIDAQTNEITLKMKLQKLLLFFIAGYR